MHTYTIRPGHQSRLLLVEFGSDDELWPDICRVLKAGGAELKSRRDLMFCDIEFVFTSPAGLFSIHLDEWGFYWAFADRNQEAIAYLDALFSSDDSFEKQHYDPSES